MVKITQINIGEELAGEVSNRDSSSPLERLEEIVLLKIIEDLVLRIAVVDNGLNQPEGVRTFDFPPYLFKKAFMIDGGKIFFDIAFQDEFFLPRKRRQSRHGLVCSFSRPTGVGVVDKSVVKQRLYNVTQRMVNNPVSIGGSADLPGFSLIDTEGSIGTRSIRLVKKLLLQAQKLVFQIEMKASDPLIKALSLLRLFCRKKEIFKSAYPRVEVAVTLHDRYGRRKPSPRRLPASGGLFCIRPCGQDTGK
ncbi:MAG: hypothetical protein WAO55_14080 [Candidatus Manganitrophaceae bacterium]